jgi:hypothetical protein
MNINLLVDRYLKMNEAKGSPTVSTMVKSAPLFSSGADKLRVPLVVCRLTAW